MAVSLAVCNSFKTEILRKGHDFTASTGDTFKVALIKTSETGTYGATTTSYTDLTGNSDEATVGGGGSGYTAGGYTLTSVTPVLDSSTAVCDFDNAVWTLTGASATLAASGCIIYNDTHASDAAVSVHPFSGTPEASGEGATFTIEWPAPAAATAVVQLA